MSTKKNAAYNVAYRIFSLLLPLVTAPYLSRTVGTEGVGLYTGAWTTSEIFCLIAMLGLADYGVRTITQVRDDRKELDKTFSGIWQMQLIVASITLLFWLGYVFLVAGKEKTVLKVSDGIRGTVPRLAGKIALREASADDLRVLLVFLERGAEHLSRDAGCLNLAQKRRSNTGATPGSSPRASANRKRRPRRRKRRRFSVSRTNLPK